jgi:hypothetical protein
MTLRGTGWEGVNRIHRLGQGPVTGSCDQGNELSDSRNGGNF